MRKVKMNNVAMFVGAALNHPNPPCNGDGAISTIHVDQYKTKFNDVRIYCKLAHPKLVQELWSSTGNSGEPTLEFKEKCFMSDAMHYRSCYMLMFDLLNDEDLIASLKAPADYSEILCFSPEELDRLLDYDLERSKLYPRYIQTYYLKWGVNDFGALRELLRTICGFR